MDPCDFTNTDSGILQAEFALKSLRDILEVDNNGSSSSSSSEMVDDTDKTIALHEQLAGLEDMLKFVLDERLARGLSRGLSSGDHVEVDEECMEILRRVVRVATNVVSSEMEDYPNSDDEGDEAEHSNTTRHDDDDDDDVQSGTQSALCYSLEGPLSPLTELSTSSDDEESELEPSNPPCIVCGTTIPPAHCVKMPCEHIYCPECTTQLVKTYISQPIPNTLFRCCPDPKPPISPNHISHIIRTPLTKSLESKLKEAKTPLDQRIYCPQENCKKFIRPERVTLKAKKVGYIHCQNRTCKTRICLGCGYLVHFGVDCDTFADDSKAGEIRKQFGWGRCPGCRFVVEKVAGCDHIVCTRCGSNFSYRVL